MIEIGAIVVLDDRIVIVYRDGTTRELLAPGRPGGVAAHSTARPRP